MASTSEELEKQVDYLEVLWSKAYDEGTKRHSSLLQSTVRDCFNSWAAKDPDREHLIYRGRTWTYAESAAMSCKVANALVGLGVEKGERVALVLPNVPEIVFGFLGCCEMGAIAVGLNPRYTVPELAYYLSDTKAVAAIVASSALARLVVADARAGNVLRNILVVRDDDSPTEGRPFLSDAVAGASDDVPDIDVAPRDVQILSYTGGTTGISKGCVYSNERLVKHADLWVKWFAPVLRDEPPRLIVSTPFTHAYAITCGVVYPVVAGGTAIIGASPKVETILDEIDEYEPNMWPSIPAFMVPLSFRTDLRARKFGHLKLILCGTCPISAETVERFKSVSDALLIEGYGLSEAVSAVTFEPMHFQKPNCVGVPISDTDVLVVDLERGDTLVPLGRVGEIVFRGPQMINEYWNMPSESAKVLKRGWMHTGDIGCFDEDGFLHIVGRKKNMIIVGGFNVFPFEIDRVLATHPDVEETCTVGAPHSRLGEVAASFVVLKKGHETTAESLELFCRENMTAYKVPKLIEIVDELPRTAVGKPDVNELREAAQELYREKPARGRGLGSEKGAA